MIRIHFVIELIFWLFLFFSFLFFSYFVNLDNVSVSLVSLWLVWLSILLIFSKNQLLVLLIPCIVLLVSTCLISTLSLIIFCCLLLLSVFASFCSRAHSYAVKLLVCSFSSFFWRPLRAEFSS